MKYFEKIRKNISYGLGLFRNLRIFIYDFYRFSKYSNNPLNCYERKQLQSKITISYHDLERGLSLKEPRPGFGVKAATELIRLLNFYFDKFGKDDLTDNVIDVLNEWISYNSNNNKCLSIFEGIRFELKEKCNESLTGGTVTYRDFKPEIHSFNYSAFVKSRFSLRNFGPERIPDEVIKKSVEISIYSPSACNRQPVKIHVLKNKSDIIELGKLQGGTNGFVESIDKLIIVTADLRTSIYYKERNQHYVDGGVFAMNLLLALHSLGVGAVILNWASDPKTDKQTYNLLGIPKRETIVVRIAVGSYPKNFKVPKSLKRKPDEILVWH
ncbi:nitroreductase family protein [Proteiniphilum sp.]|uniref:nitroreductase family protein n=1 Tax=Proteiniphilum sp. TaxID=1926877 RepID=UPI002B21570A|nr:nitroreductase family protein [Proteiniphilum sp.]MEA4918558.1 nitroreductase family protein [Proteiniphilum sp.]